MKPDVLWVHKSQDHFIAAPVPVGEKLYVSSINGFNVPSIGLLLSVLAGGAFWLWYVLLAVKFLHFSRTASVPLTR